MVNIREILVFGIIGVLNTSIDIGVFMLLKYIFNIDNQSIWIVAINLISIIVAIVFSYFSNKIFAFQHKTKPNTKEVSGFLIINLFSFIVNTSILKIIIRLFPPIISIPFISLFIESALIGKLLGSAGSMIVSFIGYKFFVFKK